MKTTTLRIKDLITPLLRWILSLRFNKLPTFLVCHKITKMNFPPVKEFSLFAKSLVSFRFRVLNYRCCLSDCY